MPKRKRPPIAATRKTNTVHKRRTSHKTKLPKLFLTRRQRPLYAAVVLLAVGGAGVWLRLHAPSWTLHDQLSGASGQHAAGLAGGVQPGSSQAAASGSGTAHAKPKPDGRAGGKPPATGAATAAPVAPASVAKAAGSPAPAGRHAAAAAAAPAPLPMPTGWHDNIITTIFWAGELPDASNAGISNVPSAWDEHWSTNYGGFDDPDHRSGYYPAAFLPKENPFYVALPYNDLDPAGARKATAGNCPNTSSDVSWCKNAWLKIAKGTKTAYAQWEDVGPMQEDDAAYVFGSARPANSWGAKAGLDVSPAVRDYLGLGDVDTIGWSFVPAAAVPAGPWKAIVTTNPGGW